MGNKKVLVSLVLVYISIQHVSTLEFFLAELDFTRIENEGLTNPIIISKESSNAEEVVVRLSLFTFAEYDAAGLPAPTTPLPTQRPDPAENEPGPTGRRDFNGNPIDIVFPPSSGNVDMNIAGILIDDEINEAQEGLIVRIEIMTIGQADMQQLRNSTRDTALIRIVDNDDIRIGFSVSTLLVSEGEGLVTGRVSIGIENGVITEQEPAVSVVFNQAVALPGMDYNIVAPINSTLVFSASVRNIDVQVQVIDDQLFESAENFNGQVSIPQNAVSGLRLGSNSNLIVTIADNEVIEVGFLRDVYRVSEANGSVTVQYAVLTPADVNLLSPTVFLQMTVTVINGTAFENMHFGVSRITTPTLFSILTSMTSATAMFSTTDDAEPNPNREFSVMLTRLGDNFNLTVPVARVIIEDNDGGGQVEINILPSPQLEVIEGSDVNISCGPLTLPDPIRLLANGVDVSTPLSFEDVAEQRVFQFGAANRSDNGTVFQCASGSLLSNETLLVVFYPPLYTGQATHEVIEGQEFRIMLQLIGNPLPLVDTITWTFNGQPLSIGGGINFGLDFIEFSSINRTNEGNYTVTSSNLAGNASFALSISVFYPPLYTGQATHEVIEGQEFRIMLQLTGNPLPLVDTVTWTFNGQPLSIGGGINFGLDFIEFSSINRTNEGNYTVTSSNLAGNASFALSISVFYPPEYTIASVFTVREGDPFIPQIGLQGNPLPLENDTEWSLNGRLLVIMPGISFGADFINIQMVTRLDQGNYTVNSSNVAGFGSDTFTLIVETSTGVTGPGTTETMPTAVSTTGAGQGGLGGDPHFSIILPTGQLLCFSVQGEHNFTFNLMSNAILNINARFDQDSKRKEVTWIGSLGIVIKSSKRSTKIRFEASTKSVHLNDKVTLSAKNIDKVTVDGMKVKISEASKKKKQIFSDVDVELVQAGVRFTVRFTRGHLDMRWQKIGWQLLKSHGIVGQFIKNGVEVDETRFLLHLPNMDPVPVMRKPVWHFMERETPEDQLCWVAMNPGYQGKGLIEGHYLDYLVDDVLSSKFKFKEGKYKKLMKYFLK